MADYKINYGVNEEERTISVVLRDGDGGRYYDCYFILDRYLNNDRPCLSVYSRSEGLIMRLTTNLPGNGIPFMDAFLDENNCPGVKRFLVGNGFATDRRSTRKSGYCEYPRVHLLLDKIVPYMDGDGRRKWGIPGWNGGC